MAATALNFEELNRNKADMSGGYNLADPRGYYDSISQLGYEIPTHARPVFAKLIQALARARGLTVPAIVDLGCSYGVNAALLKYGLTLEDLYARHATPQAQALSVAETICQDRDFYSNRPTVLDVNVVGLDIAPEAIGYATAVTLHDDGIAANYEEEDPTPAEARLLAGTDMVLSTGCVGYVGERTFERILATAQGPAPWIASYVLRMFPYGRIEQVLAGHGLVTESFGLPVPQRRFATPAERAATLAAVTSLGRDPTGLEADGRYFAELHLSRPRAEVEAMPLSRILAD